MAIIYGLADTEKRLLDKLPNEVKSIEDIDKDRLGVIGLVPVSWHHVAHLAHVAACEPHPLGEHGSPRAYFHGVVLGAWHAVPMDPSWDGAVLGHDWAERRSPRVMLLHRSSP